MVCTEGLAMVGSLVDLVNPWRLSLVALEARATIVELVILLRLGWGVSNSRLGLVNSLVRSISAIVVVLPVCAVWWPYVTSWIRGDVDDRFSLFFP